MIGHLRRRRQLARTGFAEQHETVFTSRCVQRRTALQPIREKFCERTRLDDGAGKNVGADFGTFFEQTNGNFLTCLLGQLLDANRRG